MTVRRIADDRVLRRFVITFGDGLNREALLRFSPDGRYLAAYYRDLVARPAFVWDLESPAAGPLLSVSDCSSSWSFAETSPIVVIGTWDQRVRRFDLRTGRELEALDVGILPSAVAVSPRVKSWPSRRSIPRSYGSSTWSRVSS